MKEFKNERKLRGAFPKTTIAEVKKDHGPIADITHRRTTTQFYAVVSKGDVTDHFKTLTCYGRSYSIKYAHLPHIILEGHELMIILPDLQVLIKGRCLHIIEECISSCELLWVKQSPSGKDDELSEIFIEEIQVKGAIHKIIEELKYDEE